MGAFETKPAVELPAHGDGPLEIVFSFDTTGSMYSYLKEVRRRVSDMIQRLQADIPGVRFAIFAHGDYCDHYVTKHIDFTDDVKKLCKFVKTVGRTSGGDTDECYELVLHEVRTKLSWQPGTQRVLVMIGDANPHGRYYCANTLRLDWRSEMASLREGGVRIYGVRCGDVNNHNGAEKFYKTISEQTGGHYLQLSDFKQMFDLLMTVCYKEKGADMVHMYEQEVRARKGPVHSDLEKLFGDLRNGASFEKDAPFRRPPNSPSQKPPKRASVKPKRRKPSSKTASRPVAKGIVKRYQKTRVTAKRTRTVELKDALAKYRIENLPRHRREEVPEKNFMLGELAWSKWQLAISPEAKTRTATFRVRDGKNGYRSKKIFGGQMRIPALYEIAVRTKSGGRKFVVYSKFWRSGFSSGSNWERVLLGRKDIAEQIERVLGNGCEVFVRRAEIGKPGAFARVEQSLKRYDYAWCAIRAERKSHRQVTKLGVAISDGMET